MVIDAFDARRITDNANLHYLMTRLLAGVEKFAMEGRDSIYIQEPYEQCVILRQIFLDKNFKVTDIVKMDGMGYANFQIFW